MGMGSLMQLVSKYSMKQQNIPFLLFEYAVIPSYLLATILATLSQQDNSISQSGHF
ncbi:hypothetical protein NTE_03448 [Candidatus Nitrososphaera evergladensis SR1]|uniref:Uncharacterized protein n=1 Tax=Candidatus Nitrososphaera evergladensis SR1 TaxID=1459636 RepID=A0A075MUZ0_9ARCH|nr:hypothetical protein NTE_03448 [Candidatus Nitrososphaera evergladensis SR1]